MNSDGKITGGKGFVMHKADAPVLIAVLERWYRVYGPNQGNIEVEYKVNGEVAK